MTKSESERSRQSLITGMICPKCGQKRSRKISKSDSYELKCSFCGNRWTPRPGDD